MKNIYSIRKINKEEYVFFGLNKNFDNKIIKFLNSINLLNNLKIKTIKNKKIFKSENEKYKIKIIIKSLQNERIIIIFIVESFKIGILKFREKIKNTFEDVLILRSDIYKKNILNFFKKFYEYENNIRIKILITMHANIGNDWLKSHDENIYNICKKRKFYDTNKLFHELYYSEFLDLKKIILKNKNIFKNYLQKINNIDKLNIKRNKIFHGRM